MILGVSVEALPVCGAESKGSGYTVHLGSREALCGLIAASGLVGLGSEDPVVAVGREMARPDQELLPRSDVRPRAAPA